MTSNYVVNCIQLTFHCDGQGNVIIRQSLSHQHRSALVYTYQFSAASAGQRPVFSILTIIQVSLNYLHSVSGSLHGPLVQQNLMSYLS